MNTFVEGDEHKPRMHASRFASLGRDTPTGGPHKDAYNQCQDRPISIHSCITPGTGSVEQRQEAGESPREAM
eukprot:1116342-Pelagomonas_calceolata.AAC.1